MRWIFAAGLALGAALAVDAQDGGAAPLDEALLQLGSYDTTEMFAIVISSRGIYRVTEPCDRSAYRFDRLQRDMRLLQAMTQLAELPKAEQTKLVRGALEHHLAIYSANLPEFLDTWAAHLPGVLNPGEGIGVSYGMGTLTTGRGDSSDLLHWSREAILRLIVIAAAFELSDLAGEMDAIVRSAVETRDWALSQLPPKAKRDYAWSGLHNSTLYEPTVLAIGLSLGHEAARDPENLRSPLHDYFIVYVGCWHKHEVRGPMWRHHIAADGTVTPMERTPADDTVIGSFLFAECLSESRFAALLSACGFEAAATP